jgi:hypothetical protein
MFTSENGKGHGCSANQTLQAIYTVFHIMLTLLSNLVELATLSTVGGCFCFYATMSSPRRVTIADF